LKSLNDDWRCLNDLYTENIASDDVNIAAENAIFCNTEQIAKLKIANALDRHGKLAGCSSSSNKSTDKKIYSDLGDKLGDIPVDKLNNINLSTDSYTEQFRDLIIDNPLGRNILADDDMIKSERSMFNLDVGVPNLDLDIILSKISDSLCTSHRALLSNILTERVSAFSDILPNRPQRFPLSS